MKKASYRIREGSHRQLKGQWAGEKHYMKLKETRVTVVWWGEWMIFTALVIVFLEKVMLKQYKFYKKE